MLKNLLNRRPSADKLRERELMREYSVLVDRLSQIRVCFDYAESDEEIDALIYEENAVLCRLRSVYLRARDCGIRVEFPDR